MRLRRTGSVLVSMLVLEGKGSVCAISFRPSGVHAGLLERRTAMLHELMHCASAEQSASKIAWDAQPKYLDEGLPEWAAYRVSVEWQGRAGDTSWWPVYLRHPDLDVRTRSYDGVGLWSLFELELRADVVRIQKGAGIKGWLRDNAGTDHELGDDDRYCVREGGCTCPNGRDPTVGQVPIGEAHLGFADAEKSKAVLVEGETLDQVCKAGPPSGIEVHREIVFDKSGTRMSLSFPAVDSSGHGGALLAGIMNCGKR